MPCIALREPSLLLLVSRSPCRQLQSLTIRGLPKLRDKALGPLASAAGRLLHLDLTGCSGVTSKSLTVLAQLTSLHSLVLSGAQLAAYVNWQHTCCAMLNAVRGHQQLDSSHCQALCHLWQLIQSYGSVSGSGCVLMLVCSSTVREEALKTGKNLVSALWLQAPPSGPLCWGP